MNVNKTIVTKYDITLSEDDVRDAIIAYINSEECE